MLAFFCANISTVDLSQTSILILNPYVFRNSTITEIILNSSITEISTKAFSGCQALTEIYIPSQVATIGSYVFLDSGLTVINCQASSSGANWDSDWNKLSSSGEYCLVNYSVAN